MKKELKIQTINTIIIITFATLFIQEYELLAVVSLFIGSSLFINFSQLYYIIKNIKISPFSKDLFWLYLLSVLLIYYAINYDIVLSIYHYFIIPIVIYFLYSVIFYKQILHIFKKIKEVIKWLFKYGLAILVFNTVLLSIETTFIIGKQVFLVLMFFYSFALFINPVQVKRVILNKAFIFLLILNIINIIYFIFFHSFKDLDAIQYLFARAIQFSIISFSIYFYYDYYKNYFLDHIVYLVFAIIILGFFCKSISI